MLQASSRNYGLDVQYRRLGRTELIVSVIGVGTWQLGGEWGKEFTQGEVDHILGRARDLGINLIDTAECYGDHVSERLVGAAVKHDRHKWIIATKFGHHFRGHMDRTVCYDPDDVRSQLEASLQALQTDYIDLYQFHSGVNSKFRTPGLWEVLDELMRAGKVRHLGISVSPNDNLLQVDRATDVNAGAIQVVYNRLDRKPEQRLQSRSLRIPATWWPSTGRLPPGGVFQSCQRQDLGVVARVPLASGLLTGKYAPGSTFMQGDPRATQRRRDIEHQLREVRHIATTEVPEGVGMAQWALAWCLRHDAVTSVIPGCKDVHQVESNAAAAELARIDHPQARPPS